MTEVNERESLAQFYAGNDYRERRMVTEEPICWIWDESVPFNTFVQMLMDAVPAEYRDVAEVCYDARSAYYDSGDKFAVRYERPETDKEVQKRVNDALAYADKTMAKERSEFKRLAEKFQEARD